MRTPDAETRGATCRPLTPKALAANRIFVSGVTLGGIAHQLFNPAEKYCDSHRRALAQASLWNRLSVNKFVKSMCYDCGLSVAGLSRAAE